MSILTTTVDEVVARATGESPDADALASAFRHAQSSNSSLASAFDAARGSAPSTMAPPTTDLQAIQRAAYHTSDAGAIQSALRSLPPPAPNPAPENDATGSLFSHLADVGKGIGRIAERAFVPQIPTPSRIKNNLTDTLDTIHGALGLPAEAVRALPNPERLPGGSGEGGTFGEGIDKMQGSVGIPGTNIGIRKSTLANLGVSFVAFAPLLPVAGALGIPSAAVDLLFTGDALYSTKPYFEAWKRGDISGEEALKQSLKAALPQLAIMGLSHAGSVPGALRWLGTPAGERWLNEVHAKVGSEYGGSKPPPNQGNLFDEIPQGEQPKMAVPEQTPGGETPLEDRQALSLQSPLPTGKKSAPLFDFAKPEPAVPTDTLSPKQWDVVNQLRDRGFNIEVDKRGDVYEVTPEGGKFVVSAATAQAMLERTELEYQAKLRGNLPPIGGASTPPEYLMVDPAKLDYDPRMQARAVGSGTFDPRVVKQIVENFDPALLTPLDVVPTPGQPGRYTVLGGMHRGPALTQLGVDAPVRVHNLDITDPQQLSRAMEIADATNATQRDMSLKGLINIIRRASSDDPTAIRAKYPRFNDQQIIDAQYIGQLPGHVVDTLDQLPASSPQIGIAAEVGRGAKIYGLTPDQAEGMYNRFAAGPRKSMLTRPEVRDALDLYGPKMRGSQQTGMFADVSNPMADAMVEHARLSKQITKAKGQLARDIQGAARIGVEEGSPAIVKAKAELAALGAKLDALDGQFLGEAGSRAERPSASASSTSEAGDIARTSSIEGAPGRGPQMPPETVSTIGEAPSGSTTRNSEPSADLRGGINTENIPASVPPQTPAGEARPAASPAVSDLLGEPAEADPFINNEPMTKQLGVPVSEIPRDTIAGRIGAQPTPFDQAALALSEWGRKTEKLGRPEQDALFAKQRAEQAAKGARAYESAPAEQAGAAARAATAGGYERPTFKPLDLTPEEHQSVLEEIKSSPLFTHYGERLAAEEALHKLEAGVLPMPAEWEKLARLIGPTSVEISKNLARFAPRNWLNGIIETMGISRALLATADLSATLRQGITLAPGHPFAFADAFAKQLHALVSKEAAAAEQEKIQSHADYHLAEESRLANLNPESTDLNQREEAWQSRILQHIPVVGAVVRASERAFVTFTNKLRHDIFYDQLNAWRDEKVELTPKRLEDLANYLNNATGRGSLGWLDAHAATINAAFFAPRFTASRFELIADLGKLSQDIHVRKLAAKDLGLFVATGVSMLTLLKQSGVAKVQLDPRSSDFGKYNIGGQRHDFWAGFGPIARLVAQEASGKVVKNGERGNVTEHRDRTGAFLGYLRTKASPSLGLAIDVHQGKSLSGADVDRAAFEHFDRDNPLIQRTVPLFFQDAADAYKQNGLVGLAGASSGALGEGVQSYDQSAGSLAQATGIAAKQSFKDAGYPQESTGLQSKYWIAKLKPVGGDPSGYDSFEAYRKAYVEKWTDVGVKSGKTTGDAKKIASDFFDKQPAVVQWKSDLKQSVIKWEKAHADLLTQAYDDGSLTDPDNLEKSLIAAYRKAH